MSRIAPKEGKKMLLDGSREKLMKQEINDSFSLPDPSPL